MSKSRTISTVLVSLLVGAITFFIAAPKNVMKKREKEVSEPVDENIDPKENLFI